MILRKFTHGTVQNRFTIMTNETLWSKPSIPDLSSVACYFVAEVYCKSMQPFQAGAERR